MKRDHNITRITRSFDKLSSAIDDLTDLGVIRSRKYLPDFAEWLVAQLYSGKLAESKTQKYWDVKIKNNKVQVKAHSKAVSNSNRWTPIKDINKFDILVIVVFTVNFKVRELYHIPTQKLKPYLKPYKKNYKVNWNEIKEWEVKKDSFHDLNELSVFFA